MPNLAFTSTALSTETLVLFSLYIVVGIYAIFSAILYYHWNTYATEVSVSRLTLIVYFATTIPLILIMVTMALII